MAATLSSLNVALERVWSQKTLEEQLYQGAPFLEKIQKITKHPQGEMVRTPLHVSRNSGYSALPAGGGALKAAGNQGLAKAEWYWTNHHMQIAVQGDAIDGSAGNQAIVEGVDLETKGALTDLRRQLNRQCFMNGDALIALCRASATNDIDLNAGSTSFYNGTHALDRGWIYLGQTVDVGTTANEVLRQDGETVTAIDETNVAFTTGSAETAEDTSDYVSEKDSRSGTTSYEMNGLANLISATATVGNLTVAAQPTWKSTVNATSQPLTLAALLTARTKVFSKSGEEPDFLFTSPTNASKLYQQFQQQIRYSGDSGISAGNLGAPRYLGMELNQQIDCQDTRAYVGRFDAFFVVQTDQPYWVNKHTGGGILAWQQGYDAYVSKLSYRLNLGLNRRNTQYAFTALT